MMFIDATEGVSADMLLAALVGLLPEDASSDAAARLRSAGESLGARLHLAEAEEDGDKGLVVSWLVPGPPPDRVGHQEAFSALRSACNALGRGGDLAEKVLTRIFDAESEAHGVPPGQVHLHEVGRPQALLNIAGTGFAASALGWPDERFACSTITTGRGLTTISHGQFRVPAPATAFLLRGLRHMPGDHPGERATPTGVAALGSLVSAQTDDAPAACVARSVGFGTKRFAGRAGRVVASRCPDLNGQGF